MNYKKERLQIVDIVKGIGVFLIIVGHCYTTSGIIEVIIYSFHLPIFFLVSGILYNPQKPLRRNKTVHLLAIYLIGEIPFGIIQATQSGQPMAIVKDILLLKGAGNATWFIPCYIIALLIMKWSFFLISYLKKDIPFVEIIIISGLFTLGLVLRDHLQLIVLLRSCVGAAFMLCGYYGKKEFLIKRTELMLPLAVILAFLAINNGKVDLWGLGFSNPVLYFINALLGSYLVFQVGLLLMNCKCVGVIRICFEKMGKNSLVFLWSHVYFIGLIRYIDQRFFNNQLPRLMELEGLVIGALIVGVMWSFMFVIRLIVSKYRVVSNEWFNS